jgi:hypothetical protein
VKFFDIVKLSYAPVIWFLEKLWAHKQNMDRLPEPELVYDSSLLESLRESQEKAARESAIPDHVVCRAIDLKPDDLIIHKYSKFLIEDCGCGFGAGNDFGNYFWIKGRIQSSNLPNPPLEDFWAFQMCPVIKLIK